MEKNEIKVGDVVKLKSGSPEMTVSLESSAAVECVYFNITTNSIIHTEKIPKLALILVATQ